MPQTELAPLKRRRNHPEKLKLIKNHFSLVLFLKTSMDRAILKREITYTGIRVSIAHFTADDGSLGDLVGANLEVEITLCLDNDSIVSDMYKWMKGQFNFLDHRTLIAQFQQGVTIREKNDNNKYLEISWLNNFISLPKEEICLLPTKNTHPLTVLEYVGKIILNDWKEQSIPIKIRLQAQDLPYRIYKIEINNEVAK